MGLARIVQMEGFGALYVGVLPAICSMAPSGAVFYGVYDLLKVRLRLHVLRVYRLHWRSF